jgi:hypothetical protein
VVHFVGVFAASICVASSALSDEALTDFSPQKAGFTLKFKQEVSPYKVMAVFVLPGETLALEVLNAPAENEYHLEAGAGKTIWEGTNRWKWQAPEGSGVYPVQINHVKSADWMTLNVFVMVPYDQLKGGYLNGYRIGKYPAIPLKRLPIYKPPKGFLEVTSENQDTLVSPHFMVKQFLCKQAGEFPKYLVLKERLLLKLELILEKTNARGYRCNTFHIMSGYRTPYYNELIGNVKYSRHLWGGAADIFIDENPRDEMMDDLNGDGVISYRDAAILYNIIDEMYGKSVWRSFVGGLGRYKRTTSHGPFVHTDTRGFRARWGD